MAITGADAIGSHGVVDGMVIQIEPLAVYTFFRAVCRSDCLFDNILPAYRAKELLDCVNEGSRSTA